MKHTAACARIAGRLRARGFEVVEIPGWQNRTVGQGTSSALDLGDITCHTVHHTVDKGPADYPSLAVVRDGRPGLRGPLAQWGTGRSGVIYLFAAGYANHAGACMQGWQGNSHAMANEIANDGTGEPYPDVQIRAAVALAEEIVEEFALPIPHVLGHKETCSPYGRKVDPSFDMNVFRAMIGLRQGPAGTPVVEVPVTPPPPVPAPKDDSRRTPDHLPTVSASSPRGDGWAKLAQQCLAELGYNAGRVDGIVGAETVAAIKRVQRDTGLAVDGACGMKTWCLGILARKGVLRRDCNTGSACVELLQNLVGYRGAALDRAFGPGTEGRVKQIQRWGNLTGGDVDGVVGQKSRSILALG